MMKKFSLLLFACLSGSVFASSHPSADITRILTGPAYPGRAYVKITPEPNDKPACNTDSLYNYVFDITTAEGQASLSLLMMAKANNQKVWIGGSGNCTLTSSEDLSYVVIQN